VAPAALGRPTGLAVDGRGVLTVVDAGQDRIRQFDGDGRPLADWGGAGAAPGQFRFHDTSVMPDVSTEDTLLVGGCAAVDAAGRVCVADTGNRRVQVFDRDGRLARSWACRAEGDGLPIWPFGWRWMARPGLRRRRRPWPRPGLRWRRRRLQTWGGGPPAPTGSSSRWRGGGRRGSRLRRDSGARRIWPSTLRDGC
jgi:hypothetical protein